MNLHIHLDLQIFHLSHKLLDFYLHIYLIILQEKHKNVAPGLVQRSFRHLPPAHWNVLDADARKANFKTPPAVPHFLYDVSLERVAHNVHADYR